MSTTSRWTKTCENAYRVVYRHGPTKTFVESVAISMSQDNGISHIINKMMEIKARYHDPVYGCELFSINRSSYECGYTISVNDIDTLNISVYKIETQEEFEIRMQQLRQQIQTDYDQSRRRVRDQRKDFETSERRELDQLISKYGLPTNIHILDIPHEDVARFSYLSRKFKKYVNDIDDIIVDISK